MKRFRIAYLIQGPAKVAEVPNDPEIVEAPSLDAVIARLAEVGVPVLFMQLQIKGITIKEV